LNEVRDETESNFLNICEFSIFFQVPDKQIQGITFHDERGNIIDAKTSTWKMAKPEDFEIIFNREFEKTELEDNEKDKQFFCKWLNKFVHQLEKDYKKALIIKERSPELLCTNDLFKKWLTEKIDSGIPINTPVPDKEPVPIIKYTIKKDDSIIQNIFDHCNKNIFDCEYQTFRDSIETANFNNLNIKCLNKVQDLTYRLSGIMIDKWYADICKKMSWEKSKCSGLNDKLKNQRWIKQLEKILPRPKKE
jgi:hypothetical protein